MNEGELIELLRQFPWEPAWLLAPLLGLIYGTLFRLIWGRRRNLLLYWLVGVTVMLAGQWLFGRAPLTELSLGNLRIVEDSVVCWLALFLVNVIKL